MNDYEKMSDQELLAAILEGNEAAFAEFIRRHRNQITNYIYRMLDDYDRAVDLAQETFVRVWMGHGSQESPRNFISFYRSEEQKGSPPGFSTYIYRIAHVLAVQELRRRQRKRKKAMTDT